MPFKAEVRPVPLEERGPRAAFFERIRRASFGGMDRDSIRFRAILNDVVTRLAPDLRRVLNAGAPRSPPTWAGTAVPGRDLTEEELGEALSLFRRMTSAMRDSGIPVDPPPEDGLEEWTLAKEVLET